MVQADLLVHVVDASAVDPEAQIAAVRSVIAEIGGGDVEELIVFNKIDLADADRLQRDHPGSVAVSAATGAGLDTMLATIGDRLRSRAQVVELLIPFERGDILAQAHREGQVLDERADEGGMVLRARLDDYAEARLRPFRLDLDLEVDPTSTSTSRHERSSGRRARFVQPEVALVSGFVLPPYPYDRLKPLAEIAGGHPGGMVDLSIGTPFDPPPAAVVEALGSSGAERGYPPSIGTAAYREAAARWLDRRLGASVDPATEIAACIGTKEFVASAPLHLRLRAPDRDTVLYPEISYPSYAMGAALAGCRSVAVPVDDHWRLDLDGIDPADAARAVCLWVNTPGNPAGGLDDLGAIASWGRAHGVTVLSDECYVEFTWSGEVAPGRPHAGHTILEHGTDGVLAVHSLSKRSNLAGVRAGFYAGDAELVHWLREIRKHAGAMVPGPVQAAAIVAFDDDDHVDVQRATYRRRLEMLTAVLGQAGYDATMPAGAFYLWVPAPDGDAWAMAADLAERGGALVSPGEFYGDAGAGHVRIAAVQPDDRLALVGERLDR